MNNKTIQTSQSGDIAVQNSPHISRSSVADDCPEAFQGGKAVACTSIITPTIANSSDISSSNSSPLSLHQIINVAAGTTDQYSSPSIKKLSPSRTSLQNQSPSSSVINKTSLLSPPFAELPMKENQDLDTQQITFSCQIGIQTLKDQNETKLLQVQQLDQTENDARSMEQQQSYSTLTNHTPLSPSVTTFPKIIASYGQIIEQEQQQSSILSEMQRQLPLLFPPNISFPQSTLSPQIQSFPPADRPLSPHSNDSDEPTVIIQARHESISSADHESGARSTGNSETISIDGKVVDTDTEHFSGTAHVGVDYQSFIQLKLIMQGQTAREILADFSPPESNISDLYENQIENQIIVLDPTVNIHKQNSKNDQQQTQNKVNQTNPLTLSEIAKKESDEKKRKQQQGLLVSENSKNKRRLGRLEKKALGLLDIPRDCMTFNDALVIHQMWKEYIWAIISHEGNPINIKEMGLKVMHSDIHGAYIEVVQSKCTSMIGLNGIIIRETQNTLTIVTPKNVTKIIPKQICDFHFFIERPESSSPQLAITNLMQRYEFSDGYWVKIAGINMCIRPFERVLRVPKSWKPVDPLFLQDIN
ncbi:MAG: hypothetical protein EZS28_000136 [Streblomastix strix]|uniref:Uncharacterized protein n=1 Tax=Streblomastix strix TaxID=222440 RepID=A0A5J4XB49_9EUKA|nr:MAG: hypothetical protein EZS28_000136 [Streblomastix strix]